MTPPTKKQYRYVGFFDNGQPATGYGPKRQIEAIATLASTPGFGPGRKVCVYRFQGRGMGYDPNTREIASCWVKGAKERRRRRP
jgi:hypothetical protein